LAPYDAERAPELTGALIRRQLTPALRARLAISGTLAASLSLGERRRRRLAKEEAVGPSSG